MENILSKMANKSGDATISYSLMSSAAGAATAYMSAILESTTPEVKRMFSEYMTQHLLMHGAVTDLSIKRDWYAPYETPANQIQIAYHESENIIQHAQH